MFIEIKGFEDYKINDKGVVISKIFNRPLKQYDKGKEYCAVRLYKNGKSYYKTVHRLVAQNFIPNPNNYPQVNHINANKKDNRVENLEWTTSFGNMQHITKILGHCKPYQPLYAKNIDTGEVLVFNSHKEAKIFFGWAIWEGYKDKNISRKGFIFASSKSNLRK